MKSLSIVFALVFFVVSLVSPAAAQQPVPPTQPAVGEIHLVIPKGFSRIGALQWIAQKSNGVLIGVVPVRVDLTDLLPEAIEITGIAQINRLLDPAKYQWRIQDKMIVVAPAGMAWDEVEKIRQGPATKPAGKTLTITKGTTLYDALRLVIAPYGETISGLNRTDVKLEEKLEHDVEITSLKDLSKLLDPLKYNWWIDNAMILQVAPKALTREQVTNFQEQQRRPVPPPETVTQGRPVTPPPTPPARIVASSGTGLGSGRYGERIAQNNLSRYGEPISSGIGLGSGNFSETIARNSWYRGYPRYGYTGPYYRGLPLFEIYYENAARHLEHKWRTTKMKIEGRQDGKGNKAGEQFLQGLELIVILPDLQGQVDAFYLAGPATANNWYDTDLAVPLDDNGRVILVLFQPSTGRALLRPTWMEPNAVTRGKGTPLVVAPDMFGDTTPQISAVLAPYGIDPSPFMTTQK